MPELFDRAETVFGAVEILINNAAVGEPDSFLGDGTGPLGLHRTGRSAAAHDVHFAVNSRAPALLIGEFARRHIGRGRGLGPRRRHNLGRARWLYGRGFLRRQQGGTANVGEPAGTDTGWISDELAARIRDRSPCGHVGAPEEVAEVAVCFASHQARYRTGQRLRLQ